MPEAPMPLATERPDRAVDYSPPVGDEVKTTTCYMCACRCGIKVHLKDGRVRYIEGNPDHPVNRGVLCGKGSAGIMTQYSPARLQAPLLRVGERGSGEFKEISWAEALDTATGWLRRVRETDRLAQILLVTGYSDLNLSAADLPAGVDLIVSKAISLKELRQAVAKALRNAEIGCAA